MTRCKLDTSIERVVVGSFRFPLGVYPVESMTPKAGYTVLFEPADGNDAEGEWEEWPDRYLFDAVVSAERLEPMCRALFAMFSGRIFPILDVLGHDDYREVDPYISYDLIGLDRFTDTLKRFRDFFFEDGMCGFGAMTEEPFFYVFVDEHKIVTIRAEPEMKERIEKILHAFDLEAMDDPAGADSASHEHRSVLLHPQQGEDLVLTADEIVERLRDEWRLILNVNARNNLDEEGNPLGTTLWRCLVRCWGDEESEPWYAETVVGADNLEQAEEAATEAAEKLDPPQDETWTDMVVVGSDRIKVEHAGDIPGLNLPKGPVESGRVYLSRWLE